MIITVLAGLHMNGYVYLSLYFDYSTWGTYKKNGVDTPFNAKVKTSGIVDKYWNANPSVFLSMVKAVSGDVDAVKLLEKIA